MDFTFSAEQDALRDSVRSVLANEAPPEYVRRMIDDERGFTDELWQQLADLGWLSVGGSDSGLSMVDLVVLQEEMGKLPFPGPFLSSAVGATLAARALGADDLLADLVSGRRRGTLAMEEFGRGDPLTRVSTTATLTGDGWLLDGLKPLVLDGHTADFAIVVARTETDGQLAAFLVDQPQATLVPSLDITRKVARLELSSRPARRLGPEGDQTALLRRVNDDIDVALCAETVGACERALQMAIDYSKVRVQFDRPIATFQAIKHKIVDMLHQLELCRVGTHYAAWASDANDPQREAAAAMAKGFVGEAANVITAENIQVHGGVGFTWDVDCHLLFRRVKQDDMLFGNQAWQRQRLADLVLDGPAPP
ncbi:MAG TPA: acyl-CoA dehydrogenase family protein [Acidimicrobiales bacterium]|nr:acyl-CoA dehydrogenase family protein [Acidimicrobiales bacterium]